MGTGFYGTVETSPFTVFFHALICGIVLVALLAGMDTLPEDAITRASIMRWSSFGAVGMCLLTSAVELLLVFIALEISSIATYVLAGYRKETGRGPEAAIKYFLLGSFATAFLLYGIALIFGATGTTQIYEIARKVAFLAKSVSRVGFSGAHAGGHPVQSFGRALPCVDTRRLRRCALASRRAHVHRTQSCRFCTSFARGV